MKYHGHILKKVYDKSIDDGGDQFYYEIYDKDGKYLTNTLTLWSAKAYVDSNYDENYLV